MKNLQQLVERYANKSNGLGSISWGGKSFYETNSDVPLSLNSSFYGFILNDKQEVELYDLNRQEIYKWWGKTLDNYYPWPWYPEKEIKAFEVIRDFPLFSLGDILEVDEEGLVRSTQDWEMAYWVDQCLDFPEWFKPIYE